MKLQDDTQDEQAGESTTNSTPKPQVEKKLWFVKHKTSLIFLVLWIAFLIYPELANRLNGVPKYDELQTIEVRILEVYEKSPHLIVRMPNGSERYMEFPVAPIKIKGGHWFYELKDDEKAKLTGSRVIVRGVALKWIIDDVFRVWELNCPEKNVHLTFERCVSYFLRNEVNSIGKILLLGSVNFFMLLIFLLALWGERRGRL